MVSLINKLVIGDKIKILFDYSSASRLWYAGVLNWLKHNPNHSNIMIDFVYSVGIYKEQIEPLVISDTLALPGYEGSTRQYPASLAIIGLGFDNTAVSCLINELEPRITYLYYTNPAAYTEYVEKILEYNKQLISNTDFSVGLPLNRVAHVYKALSEIIFPFINGYNISIIPMGPKPHVLAAILLAFNYKQIQCLRVTGNRDQILHTEASGHYVATRVQYVTY